MPTQRVKWLEVRLLALESVGQVPHFERAVFRGRHELARPREVHGPHAVHVALEAATRLELHDTGILLLMEHTAAPMRVLLQFLDRLEHLH